MHYTLILSVIFSCILGNLAYPKVTNTVACQNVSGVTFPAACPRSTDPQGNTRCCEENGQPACCPPLQLDDDDDRFHVTCSNDFARHGVQQCPRSFDPDDYIVCCTETTDIGISIKTYKCCSADILAGWAVAVIVIVAVIFIALVTLCCCCCCSCCFLAQRRQQRGYIIVS